MEILNTTGYTILGKKCPLYGFNPMGGQIPVKLIGVIYNLGTWGGQRSFFCSNTIGMIGRKLVLDQLVERWHSHADLPIRLRKLPGTGSIVTGNWLCCQSGNSKESV